MGQGVVDWYGGVVDGWNLPYPDTHGMSRLRTGPVPNTTCLPRYVVEPEKQVLKVFSRGLVGE